MHIWTNNAFYNELYHTNSTIADTRLVCAARKMFFLPERAKATEVFGAIQPAGAVGSFVIRFVFAPPPPNHIIHS